MTKPRCGFPAGSPPQKRHPRRHERQKECLWTPNNVTTCGSSSMCMVQAGNWKRNEHAPRPKRGMGLALTNMDLAILSVDICKVFFQNINIKFLLEKYKFWNDLLLGVLFFGQISFDGYTYEAWQKHFMPSDPLLSLVASLKHSETKLFSKWKKRWCSISDAPL